MSTGTRHCGKFGTPTQGTRGPSCYVGSSDRCLTENTREMKAPKIDSLSGRAVCLFAFYVLRVVEAWLRCYELAERCDSMWEVRHC